MNWFRTRWTKLTKTEKRYIIALWALAITLRLIYAFSVDLIPADQTGVDLDAVEYDYLGWKVVQGGGVTDQEGNPNSTRFPAYIYFLAIIYFFFGHHHLAVLIVQAIIGSLTPLLVYLTARQLFSERTSRIAGFMTAIYPVFIWYVGWLMTENLFLLLLTTLIYLTVSLKRDAGWKKLIFMGVVAGLLGLTRGVGLPFLFIIPAYLFLKLKGSYGEKFKSALIAFAAAIAVMTPWTVRNYIHYDRIMLPSCEGPAIFWLALNQENVTIDTYYRLGEAFAYVDSVGRDNARSEQFYALLAEHNYYGVIGLRILFRDLYPDEPPPKTDDEGSRRLGAKAKVLLFEAPGVWIIKSIIQIPRFWHVLDERGRFINGYAFIIPFFLAGFWMNRRRIIDLLPLYIFPLVLYGISVTFFADARFRMPFETVFLIVGAYAIEKFIGFLKKPWLAYSILIVYFIFCYYLRLHSLEVRIFIRSIVGALGVPIGEM